MVKPSSCEAFTQPQPTSQTPPSPPQNINMKLVLSSAIAAALMGMMSSVNAVDLILEDFRNPRNGWEVVTDQVIPGGASTGKFTPARGFSSFNGEVEDLPFIRGPGFSKIRTTSSGPFRDISSCQAIEVILGSQVPYTGFYVSFSDVLPTPTSPIPFQWRAPVPIGRGSLRPIRIPLTEFSSAWDFTTGQIITPCSGSNRSVCPTREGMQNIKVLEFWAQGVKGKFDAALLSIKAVGCRGDVDIDLDVDIVMDGDVDGDAHFVAHNEEHDSAVNDIDTV